MDSSIAFNFNDEVQPFLTNNHIKSANFHDLQPGSTEVNVTFITLDDIQIDCHWSTGGIRVTKV